MFERVALIGIGLIGSSISHAMRRGGLAQAIVGARARRRRLATRRCGSAWSTRAMRRRAEAVRGADLVILCAPVGVCGPIAAEIAPRLQPGAIVTDVGSVKGAIVRDVAPHVPRGRALRSRPSDRRHRAFGPGGRLCRAVRRPLVRPDAASRTPMRRRSTSSRRSGRRCGSQRRDHERRSTTTWCWPSPATCRISSPTTSSTRRAHLERVTDTEVIKFSAGGFRDFTRIAASDPAMWRDVFLNNKEAVLEMLGRFSEDLTALQRAIRFGDGDTLFHRCSRRRARSAAASSRPARTRRRPTSAARRRASLIPRRARAALANSDGRAARSLGVRLRLADVAARALPCEEARARAPDRLPALLLHLFGASPRHAAARRAWCWGSTAAASARASPIASPPANARETLRYLARARADQRRLSRGAGAGDAETGERPRGDGADLHRRARASELCRAAAARTQARLIRGATGISGANIDYLVSTLRICASSASASASWSGC